MPNTPCARSNEVAAAGRSSDATRTAAFAVTALAVALAVLIAARDQRQVLYDDAAITFRFAERIADGLGFTYNDGDRTQGASAPLYTLLLAAGAAGGANVVTLASWIGVACYGATVGVVVDLARRLAGTAAAAGAAVLMVSSSYFRQQMLSGMESPVAALLGLVAIWLAATGRSAWAGVVAGLAVVNRLDALLLVAALSVAIRWFEGRLPWRFLGAGAAVTLPWIVFAWSYFGTPVPFSATQKLAGRAGAEAHDATWVLRNAGAEGGVVLFVVTSALLVAVVRRPALVGSVVHAAAIAGATLWMLSHVVVYSLVDLGGTYPWYVTIVYPVEVLGGAVGLAMAYRAGEQQPAWRVASLVLALLLVPLRWGGATALVGAVVHGHTVEEYEGLDLVRRNAGRFVGQQASPGEVVETCFGWIAYGAIEQPIKETCPLSTRIDVGEPDWTVAVRVGDGEAPAVQGVARAEFVVEIGRGSTATVYRLAPSPRP